MEDIRLFLIRHGRQSSSDCNVNVSLAPEGWRQAELLGKRLKEYQIDRVYSSNLIRAVETAEGIRRELGLEPDLGEYQRIGLREMDYGELTGLTNAELNRQYGKYFEERDKMEQDICIPGGENGAQVCHRMTAAINEILEHAGKMKERNLAVVSHGGAIRCYLAGLLHIPQPKRFLIAKHFENCSITELLYHGDTGIITLERLNDYAHLESCDELLRKHFV
ncbi:MAG: histidine phosphatase family protein [Lachnospiraceae bacterium]|nr:histidine phosphatase family protein [Lachnospiraceae bacterium]